MPPRSDPGMVYLSMRAIRTIAPHIVYAGTGQYSALEKLAMSDDSKGVMTVVFTAILGYSGPLATTTHATPWSRRSRVAMSCGRIMVA